MSSMRPAACASRRRLKSLRVPPARPSFIVAVMSAGLWMLKSDLGDMKGSLGMVTEGTDVCLL